MSKIFISYRREDSIGITGRIYDRLGAHFGREAVFMDVDAIPFGVDFRQHLTEAVAQCDILLAIIGEQWLTIAQNGQRRLDDPRDFVRIEIEAALQRGIPVVPVLLGKTAMPREDEMPAVLAGLVYRNAAPVDPGRDFHSHVDRLIRGLEHLAGKASPKTIAKPIAAPTRKPGDVITNSIGMKFAWIPPGTFRMGGDQNDDEKPIHRVTLTKGFYMGVYPVTQAQWQTVMGSNPSRFPGEDHPVERVTWDNCQDFCERLAKFMDKPIRLPTEAEWEYACRAGTTTDYYSIGKAALKKVGWFGGNSGGKTQSVGKLAPNARGLYDMHGNVWEWCQDWFGPYPKGEVSDYIGSKESESRVLRGGCWSNGASYCRAALRRSLAPGFRNHSFGVRPCFCPD